MRRALLGTSLLALMLFTACSGSDRRSNDDDDDGGNTTGNAGTGGNGSGSGGGATSGGGGSGSTGTGGADALPTCYPTCTVAADCVLPNGGTLYDADNYACEAGKCMWTGCNSTTECTSTLMNPTYACAPVPGASFSTCYETCTTAADCALAGPVPAYDADNYACNGGLCQWTGCNDTAECTASFGQSYVCAPIPGGSFDNCYPTCVTAADCGTATSPAYDADNYACNGGVCEWTGCNDTAECTATHMSQGYVCE